MSLSHCKKINKCKIVLYRMRELFENKTKFLRKLIFLVEKTNCITLERDTYIFTFA